MTYNVFGWTFNLTESKRHTNQLFTVNHHLVIIIIIFIVAVICMAVVFLFTVHVSFLQQLGAPVP